MRGIPGEILVTIPLELKKKSRQKFQDKPEIFFGRTPAEVSQKPREKRLESILGKSSNEIPEETSTERSLLGFLEGEPLEKKISGNTPAETLWKLQQKCQENLRQKSLEQLSEFPEEILKENPRKPLDGILGKPSAEILTETPINLQDFAKKNSARNPGQKSI